MKINIDIDLVVPSLHQHCLHSLSSIDFCHNCCPRMNLFTFFCLFQKQLLQLLEHSYIFSNSISILWDSSLYGCLIVVYCMMCIVLLVLILLSTFFACFLTHCFSSLCQGLFQSSIVVATRTRFEYSQTRREAVWFKRSRTLMKIGTKVSVKKWSQQFDTIQDYLLQYLWLAGTRKYE